MVNISNIQHFCVGDGPGIRTTVFFKGCHMRCPWCHNPENLTEDPVRLRYKAQNKTELRGREVAAQQLLPELLEDREFYEASGGGVTFSGGEVLLQARQAASLAAMLKAEGISVLVDTAGSGRYDAFQCLNPYVTGYLYDIKTADPEKYRAIGADLALVTENLQRLLRDGMDVRIRIPLIPGFNTDEASVEDLCRLLQDLGIEKVDLLPFHRLGSGKYKAMGLSYAYADTLPLTEEELTTLREQYEAFFRVTVE